MDGAAMDDNERRQCADGPGLGSRVRGVYLKPRPARHIATPETPPDCAPGGNGNGYPMNFPRNAVRGPCNGFAGEPPQTAEISSERFRFS